jgi:hypothetical protein
MTSRLFLSAAFIMGVQWSWGTGRTGWGVGGVERVWVRLRCGMGISVRIKWKPHCDNHTRRKAVAIVE